MTGRVLVTGAGSGLGRALAARWAGTGARVLVTDVSAGAAAAVAAELGTEHLVLDVTDEDSWIAARQWCERTWDGLDVLVNNAGVAASGRIETVPMADWDWIVDINLKGPVRGCRTFVPVFKRQGAGHIVNVASMAAIMNLPTMAPYNVVKAGVLSLSETLRFELAPYGIGTTVVCPGFFQTNLPDRSRNADPTRVDLTEKLMAAATVTAEDVADQVVEGVAAGEFLVLTHEDGRQSHEFKRLRPEKFEAQVVAFWDRLRSKMEKENRES
ncbi:SDR family oxidoreductase [Actinokineospora iranica]|uniref:NADP-dependent 3-hydroxy acid dehydrogenase YdfG n=1 Tax=Actinokineospora iranica TaxID=1271860 RepID=A0A1G6VDR5_9PSEU|nr:SDR family oxidoreductase [Actinokineospora iranica]SDD50976.1 NADP-dependent 3-hydroxy acid dehydrogenase YdfG [Actinokineospora iranica]